MEFALKIQCVLSAFSMRFQRAFDKYKNVGVGFVPVIFILVHDTYLCSLDSNEPGDTLYIYRLVRDVVVCICNEYHFSNELAYFVYYRKLTKQRDQSGSCFLGWVHNGLVLADQC